MSPNVIALLPEYILTITGIIIMLADPLFPAEGARKPLGWLAIFGTLASGLAGWAFGSAGTAHRDADPWRAWSGNAGCARRSRSLSADRSRTDSRGWRRNGD